MASDTDSNGELAYLSPDFDLNSLTVPRLRSILVNHDISYPASAKKAQLIEILESEVLPQAKKLLRERDRVRRTSRGITNMPNNQTTIAGEDEDEDRYSMPPPSTPATSRRGRSRPSTRASTIETEESMTPQPPPSTARSRRTTAKHPRASDTETGEDIGVLAETPRRATGRKLRKSEALPTPRASVAVEAFPSPVKREPHDDAGVFTDDNPFQSGSSPMEAEHGRTRAVSVEHKRRSGTRYSVESTPAADVRRKRRSDRTPSRKVKQEEDVEVPTRSTFELPMARLTTPKIEESEEEYDEEGLEPGEEFTPEESRALEEEMKSGQTTASVIRRRQPRQQGRVSKAAPWVVIFGLIGGFAAWWRQEKIEIGFCGAGKPTWSLADTKVPEWAEVLQPQCEPCPQHAFCYPDFEARCEQDFVLVPHPLALGGLVPLPPTCEPDGEKVRRVKSVADRAIEALRERRAKWECGETAKEDGTEIPSPGMTASELKEEITKLKRKGMTEEEFEELWRGAIGEITGREEVITTTTNDPAAPLSYSSTSLSHLSLSCSLRRYLRLALLAYRLPLLLLALLTITIAYARSKVLQRRSDAARIPSLVGMTLDRLATQAALHARGEAHEAWISVGQLRDDVLRDELKGSRREGLWKGVRQVVEGNANVRASVREGRAGDVSRVWEWVGGIGGIGGEWDGSPKKRESTAKVRFSIGAGEGVGGGNGIGIGSPGGEREMRKWDEGRPIY
ncbi:inner nuclear membrane protein enriched at telomere/subtelomere region [Emmonsiellopsis sp. PD_33]|nr:inner nuclear membrane protein enriched at telomere/subtelomere region [Emmonsiellopsis sp. PD_33]